MSLQAQYYASLRKEDLLSAPEQYAWNAVLYYIQFTQDELVRVKSWIDIRALVKYQRSITREFLEEHFREDIDECLLLTWDDVERYVREHNNSNL